MRLTYGGLKTFGCSHNERAAAGSRSEIQLIKGKHICLRALDLHIKTRWKWGKLWLDFLKICRAGRGRNLSEWKVKSFLKSAARSEPVEPAEPAEPHVGGFTDRFASEVYFKARVPTRQWKPSMSIFLIVDFSDKREWESSSSSSRMDNLTKMTMVLVRRESVSSQCTFTVPCVYLIL